MIKAINFDTWAAKLFQKIMQKYAMVYLSSKIYGLKVLKNFEDSKDNITDF